MAASNPQYPVNTTNKAAELMVEENLIANGLSEGLPLCV